MNHQAMEALYNERLNGIEHIINIQSGDDLDMKQEGLLGAYLALQGQPTATDQYLLNKSRWDMVSSIRKGKPVDSKGLRCCASRSFMKETVALLS